LIFLLIKQENKSIIKYFIYQALRYAWDQNTQTYERINGLDHHTTCEAILNDYKGFASQLQELKFKYYGKNSIEVEVKSYFRLFVEEILTPFYIFQIWACALWAVDEYYYYAACIISISLISMILSLVETKRVRNN
jgi:cation-transporting ATPase 13A2